MAEVRKPGGNPLRKTQGNDQWGPLKDFISKQREYILLFSAYQVTFQEGYIAEKHSTSKKGKVMKTMSWSQLGNHGNCLQSFIKIILNGSLFVLLIAGLSLLPFTFTADHFSFGQTSAYAKGGGNGGGGGGNGGGGNGGGGNGGGKGGGNSGGNGGNGGNNGGGKGKDSGNAGEKGTANNHGATASTLGHLNAAHESSSAMANAAPNSNVGQIADALAASTDEDGTVDIGKLSEALGVTEEAAQEVADLAAGKSEADRE